MGSAVLRSIEWIRMGQKEDGPSEIELGPAELQRYFRQSNFLAAFLEAKRHRRRDEHSFEVKVSVVFDGHRPVEFGHPSTWRDGVAARVRDRQLSVANLCFALTRGDDEDDDFVSGGHDEDLGMSIEFAAITDSGGLSYQEDRFVCKAGLDQEAELRGLMLPPLAFFAVFDGHGGEGTANFLERMLHCSFVEELQKLKRSRVRVCIAPALAQAFRATERRIVNGILRCARAGGEEDSDDDPETPCPDGADEADAGGRAGRAGAWGGSDAVDSPGHKGASGDAVSGARKWWGESMGGKEDSSGATAVAVALCGRDVAVAHVGDCRAVLSRAGGEAVELTQDHGCSNWAEVERVKGSGASIEWGKLAGMLCVTRAFGDVVLAQRAKLKGLTAEPEVRSLRVAPGDEFLLLASDGLWDKDNHSHGFATCGAAVAHIRRALATNNNNLEAALRSTVTAAVQSTETDNTTAVLITFKKLEQATPDYKPIVFRGRPKFFNTAKDAAAAATSSALPPSGGA